MSFIDFEITVWNRPHRAFGEIAEIDAWFVGDGLGGSLQSFEDVCVDPRSPEVMLEFPYRRFPVSNEQLNSLIQKAGEISFMLKLHNATPMLGGTIFGVRIKQGLQEITMTWTGKFEDQDLAVRNLYSSVFALAYAQPPVPVDA